MRKWIVFLLISLALFTFCLHVQKTTISKIEFELSAFGVESDSFPSIKGYINFTNNSSDFVKSYYNPAIKSSTYKLSSAEIKNVLQLFKNCNLDKLNKNYSVTKTDQPTSAIKIYTNTQVYSITDYGLEGDFPLQELYKIVYKY